MSRRLVPVALLAAFILATLTPAPAAIPVEPTPDPALLVAGNSDSANGEWEPTGRATSVPIGVVVAASTATNVPEARQATATKRPPRPTHAPAPTTAPAGYAPITRLIISSIGVDAAVEVKTLEPDGEMQAPSDPDIAAWYDFSSQPVEAGNAVFSGHLDYADYGQAVFWRLGELTQGDLIEVVHQDGVVVRYRVTSIQPFAATDNATAIVASTGVAAITIITCQGTFDPASREYDERLVVTGLRVDS
ncbi:MAG TPA: sortase [Thermomicrobiales bacterium]|nr:sortase [Thermomicrobiales bacterium]